MLGVGLLKRSNQKKLNPDMYVPRLAKAGVALITVERFLDATLRVLRDGQGLLLGNVFEGFVAQDDIDVLELRTSTPCWDPQ